MTCASFHSKQSHLSPARHFIEVTKRLLLPLTVTFLESAGMTSRGQNSARNSEDDEDGGLTPYRVMMINFSYPYM